VTLDDSKDLELQSAVEKSITRTVNRFNDWPTNHFSGTSGYFRSYLWAGWTGAKIASSLSATENSVLIDASAKDLHLSAASDKQSALLYSKVKLPPRYVGVSLSQEFLNDLITESFINRR
jgi:hypothetical protein